MKLDRLLSILVVLLKKERIKARELAEMFEVSVRTILRDVETINMAGIPIVTFQGANGGIGIAEGYRLDKSVLTQDEMVSIIAMLKGVASTLPGNGYDLLTEKLKNTLPPYQLELFNQKSKQFFIDLSPWGGNEHNKEKMAGIRKAIERNREIELVYVDSQGLRSNRKIEPYSLFLKGQNWYLYAWCLMRNDFRVFKVSRIREITLLETTFIARDISIDMLAFKKKWQSKESMVELELLFEKEMKSVAEEWFGGDFIVTEDDHLMAKVMLPENNWLYGFLLSLGSGVEVIGPPHIREILAETAEKIHKKYKTDL